MTDRELLELAAKAAGYRLKWKTGHCKGGEFSGAFIDSQDEAWNPLKDDGDAFRLAVKLGFRVYIYPGAGDDFTVVGGDELSNRVAANERHNGDPYAATRRAIVRAAAEIGKAMP